MTDQPTGQGPGPAVDLLVRGGTVVTCDAASTVLARADVAVHDGRILAIGPDLAVDARRVVDATGGAVVPGFVNAHMHETLERGIFEDLPFMRWLEDFALPKDKAYEPRHQRAAALLNQAEMIANGTTTFIDIFRFPDEAAEVALASGLRAVFSPQVIDEPDGAGERLDDSEAFVERWRDRHPRISAWFGPHSLYTVHPRTFERMRERALALGVGIHTHLAESRAETALVAERTGGLTPTAWLDRLIGLGPGVLCAHCVELTGADIERLASSGAGIAHCPTSNAKLGNGVAPVPELLAAGATVGLGTDSVMTNNDLDPFEEMRMAALVAKQRLRDPAVLPCADVLRLATAGSAAALGMADRIGTLEVGKEADLVVVDLGRPHSWPLFVEGGGNVVEQLVWAGRGADVRTTVVAGEVLYHEGRHLTLDLDEIADLVGHAAHHLLTKAGVIDHVLHRRDQ